MTLFALVPPLFLIFVVLGSILLGWATPTEAAACGALGATLLTLVYGNFSLAVLQEALVNSLLVTAMILLILLGALVFSGYW